MICSAGECSQAAGGPAGVGHRECSRSHREPLHYEADNRTSGRAGAAVAGGAGAVFGAGGAVVGAGGAVVGA